MVNAGMRNLAAGANPIILRKGMKKATECAVEAIGKMSQKVKGKEHIARVAAISAEDDEVGQLVADAMEKVSNNGVITIADRAGSGRRYAVRQRLYLCLYGNRYG